MKTYVMCRMCKSVYFNKSWHHGSEITVRNLKKAYFTWTSRCPACKMIEARNYEGLLTIRNIPPRSAKDLMHLIREYTTRAYEKDCQHRLIEVNKIEPHTWEVKTTDSQLANKLARVIRQSFDHVDVKSIYSVEPQNRVKLFIEFLPLFYHRYHLQGR